MASNKFFHIRRLLVFPLFLDDTWWRVRSLMSFRKVFLNIVKNSNRESVKFKISFNPFLLKCSIPNRTVSYLDSTAQLTPRQTSSSFERNKKKLWTCRWLKLLAETFTRFSCDMVKLWRSYVRHTFHDQTARVWCLKYFYFFFYSFLSLKF